VVYATLGAVLQLINWEEAHLDAFVECRTAVGWWGTSALLCLSERFVSSPCSAANVYGFICAGVSATKFESAVLLLSESEHSVGT